MNKVVKWLREEQKKLQKKFNSKIPKQKPLMYEYRGVWITIQCRCGNSLRTPLHIRDNGQCPECGKRFYRRDK